MKAGIARAIKSVASKLPEIWELQPHKEVYTGEELMLGGYKGLELKGVYAIEVPVAIQVPHEDRLKQYYHKKGVLGIRKYVDEVKAKVNEV